MIRHTVPGFGSPAPVLPLPVTMVEPSFRALLVPSIGALALLTDGLVSAGVAAIPVPSIAVRADEEDRVTMLTDTRSLKENCFAVNRRHALAQAGLLDNGTRFVAG